MSASFKAFINFIDQEEVSDEQITEIFGAFSTTRVDKIKQKRDEVRARLNDKGRDDKWKQAQAAVKLKDPTLSHQEKEELRKQAWGTEKEKSRGASTASRERAGEVDWHADAANRRSR